MADKKVPATRASTRNKAIPGSSSSTPTPPPVPPKTTRSRAAATAVSKPVAKKVTSKTPAVIVAQKKKAAQDDSEQSNEPIMAFLRIRPHLSDAPVSNPYLRYLSDTTVSMSNPSTSQTYNRASSVAPPAVYSFSRVFRDASQEEFFTKTTLPLVQNVLHGQNALLFAYGVTNAGKTYTMQGGSTPETAGVLPRAIDVLYNSTEGRRTESPKYKPTRLHGVERANAEDTAAFVPGAEPLLTEVIGQMDDSFSDQTDTTSVPVDRNYEYSIWISYAEVYNDKVYDLLDSLQESRGAQRSKHQHQVLRQALTLKPSPPSDEEPSGRYVAGLRQYFVKTAAEAKSLINRGQLHRRVYGTLANSASSRSHGLVFIKVLRGHRAEKNDASTLQVARFTMVDLAGSERTKHTLATGDRLKEAGNINNSLMVLGQCLETLRSNQRRLGLSLGPEGASRVDTREIKKGLSIVPFRHSKLTEILQDYFVGDARATMIVNVNPYDTGYDENSHVMRFAALAREVLVAPAPAPVHEVIQPVPGAIRPRTTRQGAPERLYNSPDIAPKRRVTISTGKRGAAVNQEAVIEVTELDEANEGGDAEDEYPVNPLVDALFEELDRLRSQNFELELRCAETEARVRDEATEEMEVQMQRLTDLYESRLSRENESNAVRMDSKIEMLLQTGVLGSPVKRPSFQRIIEEETESSDGGTNLDESGDSRPPSPTPQAKMPKYSMLTTLANDVADLSLGK